MSDFKEFNARLRAHVDEMLAGQPAAFIVDVDKDVLWNTYLDSFPPGTNEIFRERREHDCSCCKSFLRAFGNVVTITPDYQLHSIWDFDANSDTYQPVVDALSTLVKSLPVADVFVTKQQGFGTEKNHEQLDSGEVLTWNHFRTEVPKSLLCTSHKSESSVMAEYRDSKNVLKRSLEELDRDATQTVLDMIAENNLYRGEEWSGALEAFHYMQHQYANTPGELRDNFCWRRSIEVGPALSRMRNHSIGVLLQNISEGMDVLEAVRRYEVFVAPSNYKRPKEIFTRRMVEQAEQTIERLGLGESLGRRFAHLGDVTVNNVLFADRDAKVKMDGVGGIMEALKQQAAVKPRQFENVPAMGIEQFINDVLPTAHTLDVLFENKHQGNLMSLIAPQDKDAPTLFKWSNGFSWAYSGNITDSEMKRRVKAAGGEVGGVLRFSIQWDHRNDLDAHVIEANGHHVFFQNKGRRHPSSCMLDVDIIPMHGTHTPPHVENINWTDLNWMPEGRYQLFVNCYDNRQGIGFTAEVECDGVIREYSYGKSMHRGENIAVADVEFTRSGGFKVIDKLPSQMSSVKRWGLDTNQFQKVSLVSYSPNYWDEQRGIGNRHYFFMLAGCVSDENSNGFFNEYLREDLLEHKRVFSALGAMMKVESTNDQLSGLGFSSTKRDSVIARVDNARVIKIIF